MNITAYDDKNNNIDLIKIKVIQIEIGPTVFTLQQINEPDGWWKLLLSSHKQLEIQPLTNNSIRIKA